MRWLSPIAILLAFIACTGAWAQEAETPQLTHYVTDLTGTLTASDVTRINGELEEFDRTTSSQIVVVMVESLNGGSLEETALRVAEQNRIGQKGRDNGVLLFIAKSDRRIRIEVGYGLEGALPDALAGQIIRKEIAPHFNAGEYGAGIEAGVNAIMLATKNEYKADPSQKSSRGGGWPIVLVIIILVLVLRSTVSRRRRFFGGLGPPMFPGGGFSSGGGWGGGGGFSGGGGSFGGGGASGGW